MDTDSRILPAGATGPAAGARTAPGRPLRTASGRSRPLRVFPRQGALKATRAGDGSAQPRAAALDDRDIPNRRLCLC